MPTINKKRELSPSEKAFLQTLPPEYGDNWEDDLRREFERNRRKEREELPLLNELIDLNYPNEFLFFTQALLASKSKEEIQAVLDAGVEWSRN